MTPIFCGGLLALLGIIAALYVLGVFGAKWQDEARGGEE
jgi:hypothetical protein